ncbi:tellurite resistance TerB family protein [Nostoc parmelioides]|uniref:Tellurite resistance TerB family protein n=1 Tax=Nostoc parmelioides FACHB-3921 TaxID=2692909 RepID=A0ABR8BBG5_9NOSO|nr:tellurite resistance TerB family protein [Nostoc parmelioides]MBD2251163.1 tellurite resistance TerB family protein [Nostoc parmelioides FACHB-3921]
MNLLDTFLGRENQAPEVLSSTEAFVAIVLLATAPDGYLSYEQERSISCELSRSKPLRNYSTEAIAQLCEKTLIILRRDGFNALFNLAKESLSPELREAAFAVASDLVLSENHVTEEETNFLNDLYQALGISPDIAIRILQTMSLKNQI